MTFCELAEFVADSAIPTLDPMPPNQYGVPMHACVTRVMNRRGTDITAHVEALTADQASISETMLRTTILNTLEGLFREKVSWGNVVAMYALSFAFAKRLDCLGLPLASNVAQYVSEYVKREEPRLRSTLLHWNEFSRLGRGLL